MSVSAGRNGGKQASVTQMHTVAAADIDQATEALIGEWLSLEECGEKLGLNAIRVKQLLRDHKLIAVRRAEGLMVPAVLIQDGAVVKGLHGTLTVLADAGFETAEALRWLFTLDDSLPGTPAQALAEHRATEINRRAQALAF
jgi:hypothetical protein